ncbi:MAG: isoprenylcysteine carboxylmethyltransferase family protein [Deinococcota bacterium]
MTQRLKLKLPPLGVWLLAFLLMWGIHQLVPALTLAVPRVITLILVTALIGIAVTFAGLALAAFQQVGTTINPMNPDASSHLVTSGIYRLSRNPMYVGLLLLLAAWGVYLANVVSFLGLATFIIYMNHFQIAPEEQVLQAKFADEFGAYKQRVRRWL